VFFFLEKKSLSFLKDVSALVGQKYVLL